MPIFNLFTRKFSQFVAQNVAEPVGLTGGANSIGPAGGGGGAAITYTFTQSTAVVPALYLGAAVRVDVATDLWMCTLATTPLGAEFYGFIVAIAGDVYTVQFAGVVPTGTPLLTGLVDGTPYYLSDTVAGGISAIPPAVMGEVNLPVLWAMDNGNSVIKMSRGFIEGNGSGGGGGGGGTPNNVVNITQSISFALGDVLYLEADMTFAKAIATSLATSQAEWMVTAVVTPGSVYTIQQGGQVKGAVIADDNADPIDSGEIYYVSPTVAGKLTKVMPTSSGLYIKPFYVQQVASSYTGWLLDQVPLAANQNSVPWIRTIVQANTFNVGQWVYVSGDTSAPNSYELAWGITLATSQVAGVIIEPTNSTMFTVQQSGYITGAVTGTYIDAGGPVSSGPVYYLSLINAGNLTLTVPTAGQVSKPCYVQDTLSTNGGWVLPQRPFLLASPSANPILHTVTQTNTFQIGQSVYISNDLALPNAYKLAFADTLAHAQVAGIIVAANSAQFIVQQSGYITGAITGTYIDGGGPPASGVVYYLSNVTMGNLTSIVPTTGQVSKPVYVQDQVSTFTGEILPQRPLIVASSGGSGLVQVIQNIYSGYSDYGPNSQLTPLNTVITLSSASHRVKITTMITYFTNYAGGFSMAFTRNGTIITGGSSFGVTAYGDVDTSLNTVTFTYIDSPGSIGPLTYGVYIVETGIVHINWTGTVQSGISSLTLEEISV
jgi:hypothetical protein